MKYLTFTLIAIVGIAAYLIALFLPLAVFVWVLVAFIGCDPLLAILFAMAVGVPWSMILPHIFE